MSNIRIFKMFVFNVSASKLCTICTYRFQVYLRARRSKEVEAEINFVRCRFNVVGSRHNIPKWTWKLSESGMWTKLQLDVKSRKKLSNAIHCIHASESIHENYQRLSNFFSSGLINEQLWPIPLPDADPLDATPPMQIPPADPLDANPPGCRPSWMQAPPPDAAHSPGYRPPPVLWTVMHAGKPHPPHREQNDTEV